MSQTDHAALPGGDIPQVSMTVAVLRAIGGKCPSCGKGRLWSHYLRQVEACASCGERLGQIRADDGPPWLTILATGHIMAPILVLVTGQSAVPSWVLLTGLMALGLGLCLSILPRAKGLFIGAIWKSKAGEIVPAMPETD